MRQMYLLTSAGRAKPAWVIPHVQMVSAALPHTAHLAGRLQYQFARSWKDLAANSRPTSTAAGAPTTTTRPRNHTPGKVEQRIENVAGGFDSCSGHN